MPKKEQNSTHPLVFYRAYRPQRFADFVNQEAVKQTLQNAILLNRIAHAYLFAGVRGTGKTTMARLFAKTVNCVNPKKSKTGIEPCGTCESCTDIEQGKSLDLIEIDAASNRGIDEIRELKEGIKFAPVKTKYKVFIVDEAHMLTMQAFNALLKTLEEPPEHAIFVLATTESGKLPATILSRVQRFDFKRLSSRDIVKKLKDIEQKEGIDIEPQALHHIARLAEGSIRDAESLFSQLVAFSSDKKITLDEVEQIIGSIRFEKLHEFLSHLVKRDAAASIRYLAGAQNQGLQIYEILRLATTLLEKILVLKMDAGYVSELEQEFSEEERKQLGELAAAFDQQMLRRLIREFLAALPQTKRSALPTLPAELAILETFSQ